MRTLIEHKVNPVNDLIDINVLDGPGPGGACHHYQARFINSSGYLHVTNINFQNGPIEDSGINGLTQEVLINICIDRLRSFQSGAYACRENALALTKLEEALHWLQSRTLKRMQRGVEGTMKV